MILEGDVRECLARLADNSVQCVVTSPPYYGLRAYGTNPQIWDGDAACEHEWGSEGPCHHPGQVEQTKWKTAEAAGKGQTAGSGSFCSKCGAWRGELGLEPTPELYVQHMTEIFREVRRVLREDGTLWLNIGDSYWGGKGSNGSSKARRTAKERGYVQPSGTVMMDTRPTDGNHPEIKPKDLIGIPWMLAFALRADGWYLRQDIIWSKPNPMPESVEDRCTKSHEYVFLLTKSPKYFYDHEAVKEPCQSGPSDIRKMLEKKDRIGGKTLEASDPLYAVNQSTHIGKKRGVGDPSGRNRRSVWTIATKPFKGAHFAVMPETLVEPCIQAGTSEKGCCSKCGKPWKRIVSKTYKHHEHWFGDKQNARHSRGTSGVSYDEPIGSETVGWEPNCTCGRIERKGILLTPEDSALVEWLEAGNGEYRISVEGDKHHNNWAEQTAHNGREAHFRDKGYSIITWGIKTESSMSPDCSCNADTKPCIVLDPFSGSGTVGVVALKHGCRYVGIELNPEYVGISLKRIEASLDARGHLFDVEEELCTPE
ncbi:MAG: site-specific DNA-methyltransferase [Patescibacteria group bacterium]